MPGHFTFIGKEWEDILVQPDILLPGVEKISSIHWSSRSEALVAITCDRQGHVLDEHDHLLNHPEGRFRLQRFRETHMPKEWINMEESPLYREVSKKTSSDLFSEFQNTILVLRYKSESDGKYDALIVYFSKNLNQFGLTLSDKVLSTENKSIISSILYHYFKKIYLDTRRNHSVLQYTRQSLEGVRKEYRRMKEDIAQVTLSLEEMIINLAQQHLQELSGRYKRDYLFSADALEKLRSYRGNIRHLSAIIERAVMLSENILFSETEGPVKLDAPMFSFEDYQAIPDGSSNIKQIDGKESRTQQLLDRLEKAALLARSKGMPLTSVNIGSLLAPPITAPAITDALKKHRKTIIGLLYQHPAKWEIIREEFRPLRNLFKEEGTRGKEQGIA